MSKSALEAELALQIGLSDRSSSAVSVWFRRQGIWRKPKGEK